MACIEIGCRHADGRKQLMLGARAVAPWSPDRPWTCASCTGLYCFRSSCCSHSRANCGMSTATTAIRPSAPRSRRRRAPTIAHCAWPTPPLGRGQDRGRGADTPRGPRLSLRRSLRSRERRHRRCFAAQPRSPASLSFGTHRTRSPGANAPCLRVSVPSPEAIHMARFRRPRVAAAIALLLPLAAFAADQPEAIARLLRPATALQPLQALRLPRQPRSNCSGSTSSAPGNGSTRRATRCRPTPEARSTASAGRSCPTCRSATARRSTRCSCRRRASSRIRMGSCTCAATTATSSTASTAWSFPKSHQRLRPVAGDAFREQHQHPDRRAARAIRLPHRRRWSTSNQERL